MRPSFYSADPNHVSIQQEQSHMMSHGSDFLHMSDESAIAGERVGTEKITKDGRPFLWLSTAVTGEWRGKSFKATGMQLTMISIILLFIFPINRTVVKSNIQEGYAVSSKYLHAALKAFSEMKLKFYGKLSLKLSK